MADPIAELLAYGFASAIDAWEPDVARLRGEANYRG